MVIRQNRRVEPSLAEIAERVPGRLQPWELAVFVAAGVLLCAAICLFVASTLSFHALRAATLSSIPPGYENRFTPALFSKIIFGLRLLAAAFSVSALFTALFAGILSRMLLRAVRDLNELNQRLRTMAHSLLNDPPGHIFSLAAVLIWGIALRLAFFNEPIRNDEAYSFMHYASRPIYVGLAYYTANNHLLNTLLMHVSTSVFGASVWALRLPTLFAGILILPVTYVVVRLYCGSTAALLATALASASSPLIEYSFNARGYSLGTLFFLVMIALIGFDRRQTSRGAWIVLPIAAALSLYSVPTMLYGVAGVFIYLLLRRSASRRTLIAMVWTAFLAFVLYSPVLATVGLSAFSSNQLTTPLPRNQWLPEFTREIASLWRYWHLDVPTLVSVLIAVGAIIALLFKRTLRVPPMIILLCVAISACLLLRVQRLVIPRRSWLFLLPLYFGAAAAGWSIVTRNLRFARQFLATLSLAVAGWMGWTVLVTKSLRHSGPEAAGPRSVEPVAVSDAPYLLHGAQFICSDYFDSGLDFEMEVHRIPYRPSPNGGLLIVTPAGASPQRTLQLAGTPKDDVLSLHKIAHYQDADVYAARRAPALPFIPRGSTAMGVFTESGN